MNTFSLVQRALDASAADESKAGLEARDIETGRIVTAVQTVVDALTPADGGRYIVGFADISTAQTSLGERRIIVSRKPLYDRSLTLVEKAVVIATFAAHEIGHTLVTRPRKGLIDEHNVHTGFHALANLADDIILEPTMVERYPILADAFEFTGLWVLRSTSRELPKVDRLTVASTTTDRFNILLHATRYGDIPELLFEGAAIAERDWSRDWAGRLIATPLMDHSGFLALCDEAWERIRTEPEDADEDQPTQPGGDEPEPPQGNDESEPEPGDEQGDEQGEDGQPAPSDEDGDEQPDRVADQNDQPLDFDDESDEDEDGEDDEDGDEPTGAGEVDSDPDDDDESEDGQPDDGEDGDESDAGDETTPGGDEPTGEGGDDDGGDTDDEPAKEAPPKKLRDEYDFGKVDESMHEQAEADPYDWAAKELDQAVRTYASTTVTAFGKHGSMSTTWE